MSFHGQISAGAVAWGLRLEVHGLRFGHTRALTLSLWVGGLDPEVGMCPIVAVDVPTTLRGAKRKQEGISTC